jgi:hypothetical protein
VAGLARSIHRPQHADTAHQQEALNEPSGDRQKDDIEPACIVPLDGRFDPRPVLGGNETERGKDQLDDRACQSVSRRLSLRHIRKLRGIRTGQ